MNQRGNDMLIDQNHPDDRAKKIPASFLIGRVWLFGTLLRRTRLSISSSPLGNEKGVALITALILGLIGMLMIVTLLNMVVTGTWISGSKKRYQTALEASRGDLDFFAKEIIQRGISGTSLSTMGDYTGIITGKAADADFTTKLTTTGMVGVGAYPATNPDVRVTFLLTGPNPNITVNTTILSTSRGNSGTSSNILGGGGVVSNQSGTVTPQHIPYLYQIESRSQGAGSQENVILSAIYAY